MKKKSHKFKVGELVNLKVYVDDTTFKPTKDGVMQEHIDNKTIFRIITLDGYEDDIIPRYRVVINIPDINDPDTSEKTFFECELIRVKVSSWKDEMGEL